MAAFQHKSLALGEWGKLSLAEQLGNIGSEVGRTAHWRGKDQKVFNGAADRALELFDLTLDDPRWKGRLREIARAREVFCDAVFNDGRAYKSRIEDLDKYFYNFAYAARRNL